MQGSGMLFGFGSDQDFKNSEQVIAFVSQGGLGLPDRDYYTKDDKKSQEIRGKYVQHVQHMFELLGDPADRAAAEAQTVMRIETALAKASLTRVQRRDPYNVYHKMKVQELAALAPSFDWNAYLSGSGLHDLKELNVTSPDFFKEMETELKSEPIDNWKTYLRWHLIDSKAPFLSSQFVQADWDFFSHYLRGVKEMQPRWKRCVRYVDDQLGEALGQAYVRVAFSPELKAKTVEMVKQIEDAMEQEIKNLDWMSEATKKEALKKLHGMRNKVGYPDKWRDYSSVKIARGDFLGNVERATVFESNRELGKIGKPVDRTEWGMTPPTVNAYYNPQMNDINFPAGVLQPPLYDFRMDDAPNYGNTGSTVGHELTHGFDDEGRQFDAAGNLRDWWTEEDAKQFKERASCVENQYAQYTVVDDIKIQSKLTLGEDIADLGGTILAYKAWKEATKGEDLQPRDGLTPDQRFFIGFAQWACENETPEQKRANALTDPHSPGKYRINGVVVNMPEFAQAFSCKPGQPMVKDKDKVCVIW
jgi:endothelin-converting enzyme/putative endopeptidase